MYLEDAKFYSVESFIGSEERIKASIFINPKHEIFEGHFPGQPVVPGVCMLQIIRELAERQLAMSLRLEQANQIKYLQLLVPKAAQTIQVLVEWKSLSELKFSASIREEEAVLMKMSGTFCERLK